MGCGCGVVGGRVFEPAGWVDGVGVRPVFGVVVGAGGVEVHAAFCGKGVGACGVGMAVDDGLRFPAHFGEVDYHGEGAQDFVLSILCVSGNGKWGGSKGQNDAKRGILTMKQRVYLSFG